jgi:pimeloyl-ACP methyl ester carboxylesterase
LHSRDRHEGVFVRQNGHDPARGTLLFLHGLGDSGRAFDEAFAADGLDAFNLIVPDMPGHGESAGFPDGHVTFDGYVAHLWSLLDTLNTRSLLVVAHSMGGPIGARLCASDTRGIVRGLINIEGNLTTKDLFLSGKAVAADERGEFDHWFRVRFVEEIVGEKLAPKDPASRRYYESLKLCRAEAFLENSDRGDLSLSVTAEALLLWRWLPCRDARLPRRTRREPPPLPGRRTRGHDRRGI